MDNYSLFGLSFAVNNVILSLINFQADCFVPTFAVNITSSLNACS